MGNTGSQKINKSAPAKVLDNATTITIVPPLNSATTETKIVHASVVEARANAKYNFLRERVARALAIADYKVIIVGFDEVFSSNICKHLRDELLNNGYGRVQFFTCHKSAEYVFAVVICTFKCKEYTVNDSKHFMRECFPANNKNIVAPIDNMPPAYSPQS
jgi:hypothetical protein